ncbi:hypothetical protein [Actinomadura sp. HBU206391]|uniref:hypothetical protein n=1 Tax=Actinomadura sp. HBU206391 TaxID=2731692 RepID=UPI0016509205|nr:hypothetical protein [Actinomadura sp. HBU206391]MBC6463711.1 hypothetical protein [Actinomadura sp. HBU206391]
MRGTIQVLIGLVLALGLLGGAAAAKTEPPAAQAACPEACTMIYDPVTCRFADGTTRTFGNRCIADAYACRHGLRILSCGAKTG